MVSNSTRNDSEPDQSNGSCAPRTRPRSEAVSKLRTMDSMRVGDVLSHAMTVGAVSDAVPCALFYDLTAIRARRRALGSSFPSSALHCFAIKACPLVSLVRMFGAGPGDLRGDAHSRHEGDDGALSTRREIIREDTEDDGAAGGLIENNCAPIMGAECASIGEIAIALASGIVPERIVFDSPAKTDEELHFCLDKGVHINANSIEEIENIASIACKPQASGCTQFTSSSVIGLRINPQVAPSSDLQDTFTAAISSKFGVPLCEERAQILNAFSRHSFITCVHSHVGSQGCDLRVLLDGVQAAVRLADEINVARPGQVSSIDIGGGLAVDYDSDKERPTYEEYSELLRSHVPRLWDYHVITEFGRSVVAKAGWVAARVAEVKRAGGRKIAICHAGADLFVRPVYVPSKWSHRMQFFTSDGARLKAGPVELVDVAGPLCFSGDILGKDRALPAPERNDWLVIRDAGAYTISTYSRLTSQLVPPVFGYEEENPKTLTLLKKRETLDELVQFWSHN